MNQFEIREQLISHLNSFLITEAKEIKDFKEKLIIKNIEPTYVYRLSLQTVWESRELIKKEKKYDGSKPKKPTVNEKEINVLSFKIPKNKLEIIIPGSEKTIQCLKCNSKGVVPCRRCGKSGYLKCSRCNGTQKLRCGKCDGNGFKDKKKWVGQRMALCYCKGGRNKYGVCDRCNGTGYIPEDVFGTEQIQCGNCNGKGKVLCSNCYTDGTVDCNLCKRKGKVICAGCMGNGYTKICYLTVKKEIREFSQEGYCTNVSVSSEELEKRLIPKDFQVLLTKSINDEDELNSNSLNLPDQVIEWVTQAITKANSSPPLFVNRDSKLKTLLTKWLIKSGKSLPTSKKKRIISKDIKVCWLEAKTCHYIYNGKNYVFTTLGERNVPIAIDNPISEYLAIKKKITKLKRNLKSPFQLWLSLQFFGLLKYLFWISFIFCLVLTPLFFLYKLLQPDDTTDFDSFNGIWNLGILTSLVILFGTGSWYFIFIDKNFVAKKQEEINAPIKEEINKLESELEILRK